jgi:hypothetical protein
LHEDLLEERDRNGVCLGPHRAARSATPDPS